MKENNLSTQLNPGQLSLDEIAILGAQKMIQLALEAEISAYLSDMKDKLLPDGKRAIVRNGSHKSRPFTIGCGTISVKTPRTRNRSEDTENFVSALVPPYCRRSLSVDEAISLLYLYGISTNNMLPALEKLLGKDAKGLSAANVSRLKKCWEEEFTIWKKKSLSDKKYCYIWVDGIHFNVRLSENRLCILVVIGATAEGKKELIAVESGYRESKESWKYVLTDLKNRGMSDPKLAIGDGALGFWAAVRDVYPLCKGQRCWVHKTANILDKMPKSIQPKAKSMIHDIYMAPDKQSSEKCFALFVELYEARYPKAVECLKKDKESLLTFYDFPAMHWRHIRSTNVIESPFSTVRLRTKSTRGHGTEKTTYTMVFKLLEKASKRWQKLAGSNLIPLVIEGNIFKDGELIKKAA
jgi:transposase-like protein